MFGAEGGSRLVCPFVGEQSFLSVLRPEEGSFGATPLLLTGGRDLPGKVLRLMAPPLLRGHLDPRVVSRNKCGFRRRRGDMNEKEKDRFKMILDQIFDRTPGASSNGSQDMGSRGPPSWRDVERTVNREVGGWETYRNTQRRFKGGGKRGKSGKRGNPGKGAKGKWGEEANTRYGGWKGRFHRGARAGQKCRRQGRSSSAKSPVGRSPGRSSRRSRRRASSPSSSSSESSGIHTPVLVLRSNDVCSKTQG